ncbi:hypothetical protein BBC27_05745 [Acidithiobacillus ferrivorans]|uniref:AntA/AntB antirepressor domain-containing protein n=1 Tax=Acidithiobacillus ferrivorans TaxID=160808 RepID=A0A1B9C1R2_9PROT|nr:antA/AntB antirepressor family protein [Acidithiobacillus ferrivorans]OCB03919.1 hypothetical protein BBC27_05745 [Acidithiobacillus ferrivorans]
MNSNNALISLINGEIQGHVQPLCNARDLHAFLEVGKVFGAWINDRIEQHGFVENQDFVVFSEIGKNPQGGRPAKEYHLTVDTAKHIAMAEHTPKGKEARDYFIECERIAMRQPSSTEKPSVSSTGVDEPYQPLGIVVRKHFKVWMIFDDGLAREIWQPLRGVIIGNTDILIKIARGEIPAGMETRKPEKYDAPLLSPLQITVGSSNSVLLLTNHGDPIIAGFHPFRVMIGTQQDTNAYIKDAKLKLAFPLQWIETD